MKTVNIRVARPEDLATLTRMLETEHLPIASVAEHLGAFLIAEEDGAVVGAIGLEVYGDTALLRSAVVTPAKQNSGIGTALYEALVRQARSLDVRRLLLLTTTAEKYFEKKGFSRIDQRSVTGPITSSAEFTGACPSTAACMELML
jgi:N-acetylglutamate synthase-like GNAT family acetyltransferase